MNSHFPVSNFFFYGILRIGYTGLAAAVLMLIIVIPKYIITKGK
jgi:hypothetical protein